MRNVKSIRHTLRSSLSVNTCPPASSKVCFGSQKVLIRAECAVFLSWNQSLCVCLSDSLSWDTYLFLGVEGREEGDLRPWENAPWWIHKVGEGKTRSSENKLLQKFNIETKNPEIKYTCDCATWSTLQFIQPRPPSFLLWEQEWSEARGCDKK